MWHRPESMPSKADATRVRDRPRRTNRTVHNAREALTSRHAVLQHQGGVHPPPSHTERVRWCQPACMPSNVDVTRVRGGPRGSNRSVHNDREELTSLPDVLQRQGTVHSPSSSIEKFMWRQPGALPSNKDVTRVRVGQQCQRARHFQNGPHASTQTGNSSSWPSEDTGATHSLHPDTRKRAKPGDDRGDIVTP